MVLQRYQASVPDHVLMRVMNELGFGARKTLEACIRSNRERCLTAGDFEAVLKSIAWQSPTLANFFGGASTKQRDELLSEADMAELFAGAGQDPAKKQRTAPACWPANRLAHTSPPPMSPSRGKTSSLSPTLSTGVFEQAVSSATSRVLEDTSMGLRVSAADQASARAAEDTLGLRISAAGQALATAKFDRLSIQCSLRQGANTPDAG